jgi:RimJ/RimL family protein N-acetyltransferase
MTNEDKQILKDTEINPEKYTWKFQTREAETILFRPLLHSDIDGLTTFLENLSTETRRLSTFDSYDKVTASELCNSIGKYDKLRFVLESEENQIVGLIEFTLDMPESVFEAYSNYEIKLDINSTCRFGPTLSDKYQSRGIGSLIFPFIIKVSKFLNKKDIILYGGVLADNLRAIRYYEKHGFKIAGKFNNDEGVENIDMVLKL